jgi:Sap, sulfolipid-1-addressing protein
MTVDTLVLGVGAMISPAIFAAVLLILTRPNSRWLLFAYFAGALLISVGLGAAIVTGLKASGALNGHVLSPSVELAVGGLALLAAWVIGTGRTPKRLRERQKKHAGQDPWTDRVLSRGSIPLAFAIGLLMNLPGGFYLVALKDIAERHPSTGSAILRVLAFNLIMLIPIEAPLVGFIVAPERTEALSKRLGKWLDRNARTLVIVVAALGGAYLVLSGLGRLI